MVSVEGFEGVFRRVRECTPIRTYFDMASKINVGYSTVRKYKSRNEFPRKWIAAIAETFDIKDARYLLTGKGLKPDGNGGILPTFEQRFKEARTRFGTRKKLADAANINIGIIQRWETKAPKNPSTDLLQNVADILDIPVRVLLYGSEVHPRDVSSKLFISTLGQRIDHAIISADIPEKMLCEKTKIDYRRLSVLRFHQNSNPTVAEIKAISEITGISIDKMVKGEIEIPENQREHSIKDYDNIEKEIARHQKEIIYLKEILKEAEMLALI